MRSPAYFKRSLFETFQSVMKNNGFLTRPETAPNNGAYNPALNGNIEFTPKRSGVYPSWN